MTRKIILSCLLGVVLTLATTQLQAAEKQFLDTSGEAARVDNSNPPVGLPTSQAIRSLESSTGLFNVRCWQSGQLILEDKDWSAPQLSSRFISMQKVGSPSPGIYLVDFQHTFCELKQQ
ncbi:MAG: hypothetical protein HXX17_10775 [Geobacteraceae bacterium]|nr:hypothetical protein [Geobacteraceae bacterium]